MSFAKLEIGKLLTGISYDDYHNFGVSINALRSLHLSAIKKSPAHLQIVLKKPIQETEALRQGKLIHSAFENPENFLESYVVEPVFTGYTSAGLLTSSLNCKEVKEKKSMWAFNLKPGTKVISTDDSEMIIGMINAVKNHKIASGLLKHGVSEISGWVKDPETGLILQFRPDFIHDLGYVIDIKSTKDASENSFTKDIFSDYSWFYILQAAHYTHCARLLGVLKSNSFTFIAIEKTEPFALNVFALGEAHLDVGERWRRKLTKLYAKCLENGKWPSYNDKAINVTIPGYATCPIEDEF